MWGEKNFPVNKYLAFRPSDTAPSKANKPLANKGCLFIRDRALSHHYIAERMSALSTLYALISLIILINIIKRLPQQHDTNTVCCTVAYLLTLCCCRRMASILYIKYEDKQKINPFWFYRKREKMVSPFAFMSIMCGIWNTNVTACPGFAHNLFLLHFWTLVRGPGTEWAPS